ncbi:MAG: sulfite exporter TauE/SafE family protein, partial [Pseudomonadota bacterium]
MQIYLPIAEIPVNMFIILGMGGAVGFLSGMFGVGGGFLMTPLLIFSGIPPAIAVATGANQIVASSISGALAHFRKKSVDIKLAMVLLAGGVIGSLIGVEVFRILKEVGQLDLIVSLLYVVFLGIVGGLMMVESLNALRRARKGGSGSLRKPGQHNMIHGLPFKTRFKRSKLYVSVIPVLVLGGFVGLLAAVMGVGGGFIMVPALIYLLRVPTTVVIGTSLLQITVLTAFTTVFHSVSTQSVDVILALLLMVGGVIGAQFGAQAGHRLRGE